MPRIIRNRLSFRQRQRVHLVALQVLRDCRDEGLDEEDAIDQVRAAVAADAESIDPENLKMILEFLERILPILIEVFF